MNHPFQKFKRGTIRYFVLSTTHYLGYLSFLRIWHDNSGRGESASWFLDKVEIEDVQTNDKYGTMYIAHIVIILQQSYSIVMRVIAVYESNIWPYCGSGMIASAHWSHIVSYHISYIIYHVMSCHVASRRVASRHITYHISHHITSHHITSHHIKSYQIISLSYVRTIVPKWPCCGSGVGVFELLLYVWLFSWCFKIIKTLVTWWISCSHLTGVVQLICDGTCQIWICFKEFKWYFCQIDLIKSNHVLHKRLWLYHQNVDRVHYTDVIMGMLASQITSLTIVCLTVYLDVDLRKYQSSASLAFVWGIHRRPVNSPHKWPVARKMFPFDDVIMEGGTKPLGMPLGSLQIK